ncbi:unnamed protein product, partial [Porites lobata]
DAATEKAPEISTCERCGHAEAEQPGCILLKAGRITGSSLTIARTAVCAMFGWFFVQRLSLVELEQALDPFRTCKIARPDNPLRASLKALLWTFSSEPMSFTRKEHHNGAAYSSIGLTRDL